MTPVPCLSVRQPWAECLARRAEGRPGKDIENRTQNYRHRGLTGIHASLAGDLGGWDDPRVRKLLTGRADRECGDLALDPCPDRGTVIAVADLIGCHRAEPGCCAPWGDQPAPAGRPIWHLEWGAVVRLDEPIEARGRLGLWPLDDPRLDAAVAQLHAARVPGGVP